MTQRFTIAVAAAAFVGVGCVSQARRAHDADTSRGAHALSATVATLDTTRARQLCVSPDSVLAGRAACVLRDQRVVAKVF